MRYGAKFYYVLLSALQTLSWHKKRWPGQRNPSSRCSQRMCNALFTLIRNACEKHVKSVGKLRRSIRDTWNPYDIFTYSLLIARPVKIPVQKPHEKVTTSTELFSPSVCIYMESFLLERSKYHNDKFHACNFLNVVFITMQLFPMPTRMWQLSHSDKFICNINVVFPCFSHARHIQCKHRIRSGDSLSEWHRNTDGIPDRYIVQRSVLVHTYRQASTSAVLNNDREFNSIPMPFLHVSPHHDW